MSLYENRTAHGYLLAEASSALQKSIRRGIEPDAQMWAAEIYSKYQPYLYKRLFVICSEDIGMGNPELPAELTALKRLYDGATKAGDADNAALFTAHAVQACTTSGKSRVCAYWHGLAFTHAVDLPASLEQVPELFYTAVRAGNERAAMMLAGGLAQVDPALLWSYIFTALSAEIGVGYHTAPAQLCALKEMYDALCKKDKQAPERHLFTAQAMMILCRSAIDQTCRAARDMAFQEWDEIFTVNGKLPQIPDYALDKHTLRGKRMGRNLKYFFETGALISPMVQIPGEAELRKEAIGQYMAQSGEPLPDNYETGLDGAQPWPYRKLYPRVPGC